MTEYLVNLSYDFSADEGASIWNDMKDKLQESYDFTMDCEYGDFPQTTALKKIIKDNPIDAIKDAENNFISCFKNIPHSDVDGFTMLISCSEKAVYYRWSRGRQGEKHIIF